MVSVPLKISFGNKFPTLEINFLDGLESTVQIMLFRNHFCNRPLGMKNAKRSRRQQEHMPVQTRSTPKEITGAFHLAWCLNTPPQNTDRNTETRRQRHWPSMTLRASSWSRRSDSLEPDGKLQLSPAELALLLKKPGLWGSSVGKVLFNASCPSDEKLVCGTLPGDMCVAVLGFWRRGGEAAGRAYGEAWSRACKPLSLYLGNVPLSPFGEATNGPPATGLRILAPEELDSGRLDVSSSKSLNSSSNSAVLTSIEESAGFTDMDSLISACMSNAWKKGNNCGHGSTFHRFVCYCATLRHFFLGGGGRSVSRMTHNPGDLEESFEPLARRTWPRRCCLWSGCGERRHPWKRMLLLCTRQESEKRSASPFWRQDPGCLQARWFKTTNRTRFEGAPHLLVRFRLQYLLQHSVNCLKGRLPLRHHSAQRLLPSKSILCLSVWGTNYFDAQEKLVWENSRHWFRHRK